MNHYTEFLEDKARDIYPEDDNDYSEALMEVVSLFRNFDEALDTFIIKHGFSGDRSDIDEKVTFIRTKCSQAQIPVPRNMKKWYTEHKRIQKETAIRLCYAFGLTVEESEDFMRRICLLRGFDCHNVEEVIDYYAIENGLSYAEAQQLIQKVPKVNVGKFDFGKEVLYTAAIVEEIRHFQKPEELIEYINGNIAQFGYNNATAYQYIRELWREIAAEGGLAWQERKRLYEEFDDLDQMIREQERKAASGEQDQEGTFEGQDQGKASGDQNQGTSSGKQNQKAASKDQNQKRSIKSRLSLWEIYLQILGLAGSRIAKLDAGRSLKPILEDNELLHAWAADSFPSRVGLEKILNGDHASEQMVHKTISLLVFYRFWVKAALKNNSYQAKSGDTCRCICEMDKYLLDAGYPELYPGDPFDWILLHAVENEFPLLVFREFMRELFYIKENDIEAKDGGK